MLRREFLRSSGTISLGVVGSGAASARAGATSESTPTYGLPPVEEWTTDLIADAPSTEDGSSDLIAGEQYTAVDESTIYTVYTSSVDDVGESGSYLAAVDAETGSVDWLAADDASISRPVPSGDHLLVTDWSSLIGVSRETGEERWRRDVAGETASLPRVDDGLALVGSATYEWDDWSGYRDFGGVVEAFDPETGTTQWEIDGPGFHVPTVDGDRFYVTSGRWSEGHDPVFAAEALQCRTLESGELRWERTVDGEFDPPTIVHDALVLPEDDGSIVGYDLETGTRRFSFTDATVEGAVTTSDLGSEYWYVGSDGGVTAVDVEGGTVTWDAAIGPVSYLGLVEDVLIAVVGRTLVFLEPETGDRIGDHEVRYGIDGWAVAGDRFYLARRSTITAYGDQGLAVEAELADADVSGTFGRLSTALADVLGKSDRLDAARSHLDAAEYERARAAMDDARNRQRAADVLVGGTGFATVAGATGYAGRRAYRARRRSRLLEEFDRLESRCLALPDRLDGDTSGLERLPDAVRPSDDAPLEELAETVERFENTISAYDGLLERSSRVETRYERVADGAGFESVEDAVSKARREVRNGQTSGILDAREDLRTAWEVLDAVERRDEALAELDAIGDRPGVAELERQLEAIAAEANDATDELDRCTDLLSLVDRLTDLDDWGRAETDDCWQRIEETVRNRTRPSADLEDRIDDLEVLRERVERIDSFRRTNRPAYTGIEDSELRTAISRAVVNRDPELLSRYTRRISRMEGALWTTADLHAFHWTAFEQLIGDLWADMGYRTVVEKRTGDMGIDVVAESGRERIAIQAKNYAADNKVGSSVVRETGGLLPRGFDRAVVVTSSTFTNPAREEARTYGGRLELIDGRELVQLLNQSSLVPPR